MDICEDNDNFLQRLIDLYLFIEITQKFVLYIQTKNLYK